MPVQANGPTDAERRAKREAFEQAKREANARFERPPARTRDKSKANRGRVWEKSISNQHDRYRREGLADIVKIDNPAALLEPPRSRTPSERARFGGGGPVMLCRPEKGRHVDFSGVLRGGRAVRLEAKRSSENRIALDRVERHQAERLNRCDSLGGFAAVLVLLPAGMWVVPWLHWTPAEKPGGGRKKSLNPADLDVRGVRFAGADAAAAVFAGSTAGVDWLTAAKSKGWC